MNERVLELAIQAGLKKPHASDREYIGDFDWRKFGDLIVRECVGLVNEQLQHNNPNDSLLALKIKEHFGVRE